MGEEAGKRNVKDEKNTEHDGKDTERKRKIDGSGGQNQWKWVKMAHILYFGAVLCVKSSYFREIPKGIKDILQGRNNDIWRERRSYILLYCPLEGGDDTFW